MCKNKKQKYWYKTEVHACPVCGHENVYKYRVYGKKPKNVNLRYVYYECYDWCNY